MNKIIITLATLAAISGSAFAGSLERSDDDRPVMKYGSTVTVEQAPLSAPSVFDIDQLRGGSKGTAGN